MPGTGAGRSSHRPANLRGDPPGANTKGAADGGSKWDDLPPGRTLGLAARPRDAGDGGAAPAGALRLDLRLAATRGVRPEHLIHRRVQLQTPSNVRGGLLERSALPCVTTACILSLPALQRLE